MIEDLREAFVIGPPDMPDCHEEARSICCVYDTALD